MVESAESGVRVCASVAAGTLAELARRVDETRDADLVEVRWDLLAEPCGPEALATFVGNRRTPLLITCRPAWQGGGFEGSEEERRRLLSAARDAGARWVDVEMDADWSGDFLAADPGRTLLSHHWDRPRPDDVDSRVERIVAARPAIGKLVAPAGSAEEAVRLIAAAARLHAAGVLPACFAMGEEGRASRLLSAACSGGLIYVTASVPSTASGQPSLGAVRHDLGVGAWRPGFRRFGLLGHPIEHSLSPAIFNAAFRAARRPACYVPIPVRGFEAALALAEAAGVEGLSVTMPFKEEAAAVAVRLEGLAARVGAANTLVRRPEGWVGHNTDGAAAVGALAARRDPSGARVLLVGAGGAARATAAALLEAGARVVIANRTPSRGEALAADLGCDAIALDQVEQEDFDVLVNATPVGMEGTVQVPLSTAGLRGGEVVLEMIYRPAETELVRRARRHGCEVVAGLEMFVRQAEAQHRIWTGEPPPPGAMRKAAVARLEADSLHPWGVP